MNRYFLFIYVFLTSLNLNSQELQHLQSPSDTILYEKLYLHIDRELYAPGDDVWFKAYLVSGINHKPLPGFKNIYVQLISDEGRIIDQLLMLSVNGTASNDFHLPDTLATGNYTIRAYTRYLQNFGEESMFHQKIAVFQPTELSAAEKKSGGQNIAHVSFHPEGGNLVMNVANYVAFKAVDEKGRGVPVTGNIVDEAGQEVVAFKSTYRGMGTFVMMPQEGKKYIARIQGHPRLDSPLDDAHIDGVNLHYRPSGNNLQFILSRNLKMNRTRNLVLAASHKGHPLFMENIEMNSFQQPVNVFKGVFPKGISKVTLYDEQENILSERLVFVRNAGEETLRITAGKKEYTPRENVSLDIELLPDAGPDSLTAELSVAVVSENYFSEAAKSQSLESYLLLDSELKGPVEAPAFFFADDDTVKADEKLDLLMLVNGWRRYYWDELQDHFSRPLPGWADAGLTLEGTVHSLWGEKPVENGIVELGPFSGQFLILKDTTDALGRFSFERVYLKDSAEVMVNAVNRKGKNRVIINYQPSTIYDSLFSVGEINRATREPEIPEEFYRSVVNRHLAEREFELEQGSILLGEVDVVETYKSGPNITSRYGFPSRSFTLSEKDKKYFNILRYLEFEVPGVYVTSEDSVVLSRSNRPPLFYVDDVNTEFDLVKYLPMDEIVKVEIFNPQIMIGLLGEGGGLENGLPKSSGVISILTKNRFGMFAHKFYRDVQGRIVPQVTGYRQAREFYAAVYPLAEGASAERPGLRPTLYWDPWVVPAGGKATLEFHTSDISGNYLIIAEGISKTGQIIQGTARMTVADR